MKEITILSGKGGTGKTTITAAFASLAKNAVFCDNDVDASNLHLIMNPQIEEVHPFSSGEKAVIVSEDCIACGKCIEHCHFDAIHFTGKEKPEVDTIQCEGCSLCFNICETSAIRMVDNYNNHWYVSDTRFGKLIHAQMGAGEENSGKLVTRLRQEAKKIALKNGADYIINDGAPGLGCPVIASLTGTGAVLMITEPTESGFHDSIRLSELITSMQIPLYLLINKYDLNPYISEKIEQYFRAIETSVTGKIAFDEAAVKAMVSRRNIIEYNPSGSTSKTIQLVWNHLINQLNQS